MYEHKGLCRFATLYFIFPHNRLMYGHKGLCPFATLYFNFHACKKLVLDMKQGILFSFDGQSFLFDIRNSNFFWDLSVISEIKTCITNTCIAIGIIDIRNSNFFLESTRD